MDSGDRKIRRSDSSPAKIGRDPLQPGLDTLPERARGSSAAPLYGSGQFGARPSGNLECAPVQKIRHGRTEYSRTATGWPHGPSALTTLRCFKRVDLISIWPLPKEVILSPFDSAQGKLREGSEPKPMGMKRCFASRETVGGGQPLQVGLDLMLY